MSGDRVAYNLRPNKFVERHLFIELLSKLIGRDAIDSYVYVSLGGPQLEDLKLVHYGLGIKNLLSLEADTTVYERQQFNTRPFMKCKNQTSSEFIRALDENYADKHLIVWLDYAAANERREQLLEYEALLSKLQVDDTVKITINANPRTLSEPCSGERPEVYQARGLQKLHETLNEYIPGSIDPSQMTKTGLVPILCKAIQYATIRGTQNTPDIAAVPLAIFVYQDSEHQMLTITVRLIKSSEIPNFAAELGAAGWDYLPSSWTDATTITIPDLTVKERLFIEGLLFTEDLSSLVDKLPFRLSDNKADWLDMLKQFERHYRRYPSYLPVVF